MLLEDAEIDEVYKKDVIGETETGTKVHPIHTPERDGKRTWLIPSNKRYFDVKGCFNEYGEVYWSQHFNFQTGDTIYIYSSNPDGCIKFKTIVTGHDLPYSDTMVREAKFNADPSDFEKMMEYNRFALLKIVDRSRAQAMSLIHLMEHGLKKAPQGAVNLSGELLDFIENNF